MNDNLATFETPAPPHTETSSTTTGSGTDGFAGLSITQPVNAANDALVQIEQTEVPASSSKFEDFDRIRANVPSDLHGLPIWLLYKERIEPGDPKPKKVPMYANGRYRGTTDTPEDREQLVTFEEAAEALMRTGATGLGIALGKVPGHDLHISGIDLDGCYDGGALDPRAGRLLEAARSYAERSPSGLGLHILGIGDIGTVGSHSDGLEIYSRGRFFTVTGDVITRAPLGDISNTAQLARELYRRPSDSASGSGTVSGGEMVPEGQRHNRIKELATKLAATGLRGSELERMLLAWNEGNCSPPLPATEVSSIAAWCTQQLAEPDPLDRVRKSIASDLAAGPEAVRDAPAPKFVVKDRIPVAGASLAAPGGTGKTTLALNEYIHVVCDRPIYDSEILRPGTCVLVTAEDGLDHPRYILQRALEDGINMGAISPQDADRAMERIKIIHWRRADFGPIVKVGRDGNMERALAFDILLEAIRPLKPSIVTLDPASLFGPGERFVNDGDTFLASMLHEAALDLKCCIQLLDHVSQAVARGGIVDQHAARGGTGKTDNARLARQLVRYRPKEGEPLPNGVSQEDIECGRLLKLHWTKSNYGPLPLPVLMLRRGHWIVPLRAPSPDEMAEQRRSYEERRATEDEQAVIDAIREAVSRGEKPCQTQIEKSGVFGPSGKVPRERIRDVIARAEANGRLRRVELPKSERRGRRTEYLVVVDDEED